MKKCSLPFYCGKCKAHGHFLIRQAEPAHCCVICLHKPKTNNRDNREHGSINSSSAVSTGVDPETFIGCLSEIPQSEDVNTSNL